MEPTPDPPAAVIKDVVFGLRSPALLSPGTFYFAGFYKFAATDSNFSVAQNLGTANVSYGAHVWLVASAGGANATTVRVSGTSIADDGTRTAADTEDLLIPKSAPANSYYQTTKRWIGQVSLTHISGSLVLCNYGFAKAWDDFGSDFDLKAIEATWFSGNTDNTPDVKVRVHSASGWTYNAGAAATPPAAVESMAGDHVTEIKTESTGYGCWRKTGMTHTVLGETTIDGLILEIVTTATRTYEFVNMHLRIQE